MKLSVLVIQGSGFYSVPLRVGANFLKAESKIERERLPVVRRTHDRVRASAYVWVDELSSGALLF